MTITDETRLIDVNTPEEILEALTILVGSALMSGDRRLYEHVYRAKIQYENGVNLHLTDDAVPNPGP